MTKNGSTCCIYDIKLYAFLSIIFRKMWLGAYDINLIWVILIFFTIVMVILGPVVELFASNLPTFLVESFRYGKALNGPVKSVLVDKIKVPKGWFTHFYIFASIYVPVLFYLCVKVYLLNDSVPKYVKDGLDIVCGEDRSSRTTPEAVLITMLLLLIQCFRRLYECLYVNVKSRSMMNILHYIVGFAHYFCCSTGIWKVSNRSTVFELFTPCIGVICEAPGFVREKENSQRLPWLRFNVSVLNLSLIDVVLVVVFFQAWQHQYNAHKIFSDLKQKSPNHHSIPTGKKQY